MSGETGGGLTAEERGSNELNDQNRDLAARLADADARLAAVEALAKNARPGLSLQPLDCTNACEDGPCDCSGEFRPRAWNLNPEDVLAALHPDPSPGHSASPGHPASPSCSLRSCGQDPDPSPEAPQHGL